MEFEEYISEVDGKFSIDRIFNDKRYNFGVFDSYEEALEKLDYLEEEGWPISRDVVEKKAITDKLGLSLSNIEEKDDKFIIFKIIGGEKVIFGEFDSLDEAKVIRNNLIDNAWESTEPYTRTEYAKYITKDNGKFYVKRIYEGKYHSFGSFKTFDEALNHREDLISKNWGDLNISLQMRPGKYISYNGIMYTINKTVDGAVNVYGFFNELDDAIKQRDWLIDNNWSRLEVPDDSRRHIHKQGDNYLIYKRYPDNIKYFGTFSTLEDAKRARNKLVENDWVLEESTDIEKVSDFVYFDDEFYTIKKEVDGQNRIYGVYKNKNQALSDEKSLKRYDWDGHYAIPTEEYPYGENIVPFDYIFILEDFNNGVRKEIGRYYSFNDVVKARTEIFGEYDVELNELTFSVKIGKSFKNRGWSIIRDTTYDLIPKLPYEDSCDIIVDGIPTTAKLNLLPRIFYTRTDEVVVHLENLARTNPNGRIDVQLLLNKDNPFDSKNKIKTLNGVINDLNNEINDLKQDVKELKEILDYMDDENAMYLKKFNNIIEIMDKLNNIEIGDNELTYVPTSLLRNKIREILENVNNLNDIIKS